ncbi:MAG: NAD-dependent epimerase/dehydratase family protein [Elusimicrobia bacterium]|nr:NAD-dependent epimerase/dehydratase family protein [Elusimicrobiota bacterium]
MVLASSRAVYGEGLSRCSRHGLVFPPARNRETLEKGDFSIKCPVCGNSARPVSTPENARTNPLSFYALTKKNQEELCLQTASAYGIPVVILRYFNVFGSRQALRNPYTGVVTVFYNRLREGKPISLYEAGLPTRDFVHVSDVVRANVAALNPRLPSGSIFNVGSGRGITIRQLAVTLGNLMGHRALLEEKGEFRIGDILACTADLSRARTALRYRPKMSLRKGLDEFLCWAKNESGDQTGYERTVRELSKKKLFGQAKLG